MKRVPPIITLPTLVAAAIITPAAMGTPARAAARSGCEEHSGATHCYVTAQQAFSKPTAHGLGGMFTEPSTLPDVATSDGYSIGQLAIISHGPILDKAIEFGWM